MSKTITIAPVEGRRLPLASNPKRAVDREMTVPTSAYYRRAIRRGDVALVEPKKKRSTTPKTEG